MIVEIPTSIGDLLDRMSILAIKCERLGEAGKRRQAAFELDLLAARRDALGLPDEPFGALGAQLRQVNEALWEIEDALRDCERRGAFGEPFIALARRVYFNNDRRHALKAEIDARSDSDLREQKSYAAYQDQDSSSPRTGPRGSAGSS